MAYLNPGWRDVDWTRPGLSTATPGAVNLVAAEIDSDGLVDIVVALRRQVDIQQAHWHGLLWLKNPGREGAPWPVHPIDVSDARGL